MPKSDFTYLRWYAARGIGFAHKFGYEWLRDKFLPALRRAEEKSGKTFKEKEILADAFYLLGDVYDFADAPKKALQAYKKSTSYFPEPRYASGAWRELGCMHRRLGQYRAAVKALKRAVEICPDDDNAQSDLKWALEVMAAKDEAECDMTEPYNRVFDLLARGKAKEALLVLQPLEESVANIQMKACCYGQLENLDSYLEQWKVLSQIEGTVELGYADWFYLPTKVYDMVDFWSLLLKIAETRRFISGVFLCNSGLNEHLPLPRGADFSSKEHRSVINKQYSEICRYRIALALDDLSTLQALKKKYPKWENLVGALARKKRRAARKR